MQADNWLLNPELIASSSEITEPEPPFKILELSLSIAIHFFVTYQRLDPFAKRSEI